MVVRCLRCLSSSRTVSARRRSCRRGSDLRGGFAPDDAVRGGEERSAADPGDAVPHPRFVGASSYPDDQRTTGPPAGVRRHRPPGSAHVARPASVVADPWSGLSEAVRELGGVLPGQIAGLKAKILELEKRHRTGARENEEARRLISIAGVGPICVSAIQAFAPPMESFRRGRDFAV